MKIDYRKNNGKMEAQLSDLADVALFKKVTSTIENDFNGKCINKLNGEDQLYWDFNIQNTIITLHLEHFLGISIYPSESNKDLTQANLIIEKIGGYLEQKTA